MITSQKLLSIYMILCCGCCGVSMGMVTGAVVGAAAVYNYMNSESAEETVDQHMLEIFGVENWRFNEGGVKFRDIITTMTLRYLIAEAAIFAGFDGMHAAQYAYNAFFSSFKQNVGSYDDNDTSWSTSITEKAFQAADKFSDQTYIYITKDKENKLDEICIASQKLYDNIEELYNKNYEQSNENQKKYWQVLICNAQRIVDYFDGIQNKLKTDKDNFVPVYVYIPRETMQHYIGVMSKIWTLNQREYLRRLSQITELICKRDQDIYSQFLHTTKEAKIKKRHSTVAMSNVRHKTDDQKPLRKAQSQEVLSAPQKARRSEEALKKEAKTWWHSSANTVNNCLDLAQNAVSAIQDQTIYNTVRDQFIAMYTALYNDIDSYQLVKPLLHLTGADQVHIDQNDINAISEPNLGTVCLKMTHTIQTMIDGVNTLIQQHISQSQEKQDLSLVAKALQRLYNHVDSLQKYYKYGERQVIDLDIATVYEADSTLKQSLTKLKEEMDQRYKDRSTVDAVHKAFNDMSL